MPRHRVHPHLRLLLIHRPTSLQLLPVKVELLHLRHLLGTLHGIRLAGNGPLRRQTLLLCLMLSHCLGLSLEALLVELNSDLLLLHGIWCGLPLHPCCHLLLLLLLMDLGLDLSRLCLCLRLCLGLRLLLLKLKLGQLRRPQLLVLDLRRSELLLTQLRCP